MSQPSSYGGAGRIQRCYIICVHELLYFGLVSAEFLPRLFKELITVEVVIYKKFKYFIRIRTFVFAKSFGDLIC